jgi:hypothetical protein
MHPQEAVAALNHYMHHGHAGWYATPAGEVTANGDVDTYTFWEAEALARAYEHHTNPKPKQPKITGITLVPKHHGPNPKHPLESNDMENFSVQTSTDATPDPTVATRTLTVTLNQGTPSVGLLSAGFSGAIGDTYSLTLVDTGTDGLASDPSDPFTGTITAVVVAIAPPKPVITGVTQLAPT